MSRKRVELVNTSFELVSSDEMADAFPLHDELMRYFDAKTKGERLARRSDLDPADITHLLPHIVLLDLKRDEGGQIDDIGLRLMGTFVVEYYGEHSGKSISALNMPEVEERIKHAVMDVDERRAPMMYVAEQLSADQNFMRTMVSYIPMEGDENEISQMILCIVVDILKKD